MSETDSNGAFAFGFNYVGNCECPAIQAGYNPADDESFAVAQAYDREMINRDDTAFQGVISEDVAEDAWRRAIDALVHDGEDEKAKVGEEIASELGWEINNE